MATKWRKNKYIILALFLLGSANGFAQQIWNPSASIGTANGVYSYAYNQTPSQLVEIYPAAIPNTGLSYQWYSSTLPTSGFTPLGVSTSSYAPPALTVNSVTTYYQRTTTSSTLGTIYSNIVKIAVVSVNWEDINYIREHDVITTGQSSWTAIDQLAIGSKLQTTTYLDGLGRSLEKISKQTATPPSGSTTWGDMVQFSVYDAMGREPVKYLPYTTSTQSGMFKTTQMTEQPAYYSNANTYNETSAFNTITFDNSPLNRVVNVKESGLSWAASAGNGASYDMNGVSDSVQIWGVDYVQGDAPLNLGTYTANLLYKLTYTDVNGKLVIEYTNMSGQLILKKVQISNTPSTGHPGWICTYSVYDDFGLLRFQIQPVGVNYLDGNNWNFTGTYGPTVLAEQVFQYNYDDKGRTIWKKAPGASPLNMIYDIRDRVVFMQDGNQAALSTPQWTANLYDALDRPVLTTLYNTTETITSLQADIAASIVISTFTSTAPATPIMNLEVSSRNTSISAYAAQSSIIFSPGFSSASGDSYSAQISSTATVPASTITSTVLNNPISQFSLSNSAVTTILKYFFYDNYSFNTVKGFNNAYTNLTAYNTSDPNVMPIATSLRTTSMLTGIMTRILNTGIFLSATDYYDEKGRHIQTLADNIKTGVDITTMQYHFDGRLLSTCKNHTSTATGFVDFITLNKYVFDAIGRVTSIQTQYGTNPFKTIAAYDYDDMGRVLKKHLDPNYNNPNSGQPDLESLNYTFNIHNQITGINKDFALKNPVNYNKWGHFFGLYLGFDNKDGVFAKAQLNGQVTGQQWNTQGDDAQRKYDYTYDNAGRLITAAYNEQQHPGDGWSNATMDFSVNGTSGQITYDNNGNLLTMLQRGVMPGTPTPLTIDDLRYAYNTFSNKLQSVTDQMTSTTLNGQFGDFKDGTNAAGTADYVYDANGNVVVDLNKNAQSLNNGAAGTPGIHYNFLDKPDQIRIVGKGTIEIVYNADGQKLQRAFIPDAGGSGTVTTYINQFVFQETATLTTSSPAPFTGTGVSLAYINFEEGRVRVIKANSTSNGYDALTEAGNITLPVSPTGGGGTGVFDYFIMDYQQNVRMILTEETHSAVNTCTMETSRASAEDPVFGQTGAGNEVEVTRYPKPTGWTNNSTNSVSQVGRLCGHFLGPNTLQKVMAGDQVNATVLYYYQSGETGQNPNIITPILSSLAMAIGGPATTGTLTHGGGTAITNNLSTNPGIITAMEPNSNTSGTPQAYLTILFFDERFNFVAAADGGVAQQQVASSWTTSTPALTLANIKAPKNGYAYIYVSNRSDQDVYFDNLVVNMVAGNIIEENHYYAFGLKIAAISSKKLGDVNEGKLNNPYQYNDKEMLDEDAGLNWYDYGFRNYDPQIGRFPQLDPLTDDFPFLTPYQYASNDPIANIDIDGLEAGNAIGDACSIGRDFSYGTSAVRSADEVWKPIVHAIGTGSSGATKAVNIAGNISRISSIILHSVVIASEAINSHANTPQVGQFVSNVEIIPDWSSKFTAVHQHANFNALLKSKHSKISFWDRWRWLNDATVDADKDQSGNGSYKHAMRNRDTKETVQTAKNNADEFVRKQFKKAKEELRQGKLKDAYYDFGLGLHTLQDATSPAHNGFQKWGDHMTKKEEVDHGAQEYYYPGGESNLQKITDTWLEWFEGSDDTLPSGNLFDNILADPSEAPIFPASPIYPIT
jgi:RHS repeat-associated protein